MAAIDLISYCQFDGKISLAKCLTIVPLRTILSGNIILNTSKGFIDMEEKINVTNEDRGFADDLKEFGDVNINSDADIPGSTHLNNPEAENAVEKVQEELDELKDKYVKEMEQGHIEGHTPTKVTAEETKRRWGFLRKTSKVKSKSDCGEEKRTSL